VTEHTWTPHDHCQDVPYKNVVTLHTVRCQWIRRPLDRLFKEQYPEDNTCTVNQEFSESNVVSDMRQEGAAQDRDDEASDAAPSCPHFVGFTGFK
jgi:hypothetical protein